MKQKPAYRISSSAVGTKACGGGLHFYTSFTFVLSLQKGLNLSLPWVSACQSPLPQINQCPIEYPNKILKREDFVIGKTGGFRIDKFEGHKIFC